MTRWGRRGLRPTLDAPAAVVEPPAWVEGTWMGWRCEWNRRSWVGRLLYFGAAPLILLAVLPLHLGDKMLFAADKWDGILVCARFD